MALGYDGSIRINTKIDTGDFSKGLEKMSADMAKQIKKSEALLTQLQEKRKALAETSIVKANELDAEKRKLESLKKTLQEIREYGNKSKISSAQSDVRDQQSRVGALQSEWSKIQSEVEKYDAKIAETTQKLSQQQSEASRLSSAFDEERKALEEIARNAQVGNQHIIDLSHKLSELQERQKTLESAGLGLGYKEYDENARKIASITEELKKYQAELRNTNSQQGELKGFLGTLNQIKESFGSIYASVAPALGKMSNALARFAVEYARAVENAFEQIGQRIASTEYFQLLDRAVRLIGERISNALQPALDKITGSETFQKIQQSLSGAFEAVKDSLGGFTQKVGPELSATVDLFKIGFYKIGQLAVGLAGKFGTIIMALKPIADAISAVVSKIAGGMASLSISMAKSFHKLPESVKAFTNSLGEAVKGVVKFAAENNVLTKITDAVGKKLERLGGMIRRVFVFSVITRGLREMRSELASYLALNEQFSSALRTLQGVLLTAFQPIYDVVVPALTTLINMVSHAIAAVSQFIAFLFGTTAKKAQQNAKSLYQQAHAVKAVGSAAKEAAKEAETAVAAFDEFNILSFPDSSNGGGGGGSGGVEIPDFEYEYDDMPFDSWGEAFSAFLDKLLDGLPKLEAAFKKFADWLNDLAKKLYDMFTFPGVLDKVKALGKGLAEALNKLVNWIDWEMLGRALGAGLNLALNFLTSFLYAFDWFNLGKKLAEFVNGLVDEIDWYEFGRLLWAGFKIALETLAGFILGLDMPLMAQAASNIVLGFFDEMYNTIQRIPWFRIGAQIASFLNNIDWYGCLTAAIRAIQAALQAMQKLLAGFVISLQWNEIAEQIYTAINDSFGRISWSQIGRTLSDAFIHIVDFIREIIAGLNWEQIGKDVADFVSGIDWDGVGKSILELAETVVNSITTGVKAFLGNMQPEILAKAIEVIGGIVTGFVGGMGSKKAVLLAEGLAILVLIFNEFGKEIKELAQKLVDDFNKWIASIDWKKAGTYISDGFKNLLDTMIIVVEGINWIEVGEAIGDMLSSIDWIGILERVGRLIGDLLAAALLTALRAAPGILKAGAEIVGGLIAGIIGAVKGIGETIKTNLVDPIVDAAKKHFKINSPSKVFEEIGRYLVEGLLQGIKETWSGILEFFQEKVEAIKEFFQGAWDGIKEHTSQAWENIKTTLGSIWDSIKETAATTFDNIKEKITTAWDGIKEKTSAIWDGIKTTLSAAWDSLKEKAAAVFDGIKEKISTIWDNIKEKATTIWDNIKTALTTAWENLKTTATTTFENIKTAISTAWENVKSKTTEIWNNIKTTLTTLWNELKTTVTTVFTEIKNKVVEVWTSIKNEAVSKWNEIKSTISNKINEIKQNVSEGFAKVKETITSKVTEAIDALKSKDWASVGRSIVDGIYNGLHGIFDKLSSWASKVWDTVSGAFSSGSRSASSSSSRRSSRAASYSMASLPEEYASYSARNVPMLANGAVIPPNQQFLAILGDQRRGVNVEAPLATIEQAVQNVMERMGGMGGDIHITVESVLDGNVVARNTVKHSQNRSTIANGVGQTAMGALNVASSLEKDRLIVGKGTYGNNGEKTRANCSGGNQPHNNMPPYYALCYIIKVTPDATDGGSGDIYSTEEIQIGEWIDGKPLYRKVYEVEVPNFGIGDPSDMLVYDPTFTAVRWECRFNRTDGYSFWDSVIHAQNSWSLQTWQYGHMIGVNGGGNLSSVLAGTTAMIILEYTKTTDEASS